MRMRTGGKMAAAKHTWYVWRLYTLCTAVCRGIKGFCYWFSELRIPFEVERDAEVAYNSLRVDPEPPRSGVTKKLDYYSEENVIIV